MSKENNYMTETERMTLKHILKFDNRHIEIFDSFNLDDKQREFIIFNMLVKVQEKERKKHEKQIEELIRSKSGFLNKFFKR